MCFRKVPLAAGAEVKKPLPGKPVRQATVVIARERCWGLNWGSGSGDAGGRGGVWMEKTDNVEAGCVGGLGLETR